MQFKGFHGLAIMVYGNYTMLYKCDKRTRDFLRRSYFYFS